MPPKPKLYVQYQPIGQSLRYITDMQSAAARAVPSSRLMPLAQIHLTIIHYGKFAAIFESLKKTNPGLSESVYQLAVARFVERCEGTMPTRLSAWTTGLAAYGPNGKVIVVELSEDKQLMAAQAQAAESLLDLFQDCGISNPEKFQKEDYNFQFVSPYHPHITMLKQAQVMPELSFKAQLLELQLMPFWYD